MPDEHPVAHRARLLAEGEAEWRRLRALLDARADAEAVHRPGSPPWTAASVYAHFARYQSGGIAQLHRRLAGLDPLPPDGLDDDTRNERWAAEDRALTFEQARDWCLETTRVLRDLLLGLTPEQWAEFGPAYGDDVLAPHYRAHIRYIETAGREGG